MQRGYSIPQGFTPIPQTPVTSPCPTCPHSDTDRMLNPACRLDTCQALERYNAYLENRPPVDLAAYRRQQQAECAKLSALTPGQKIAQEAARLRTGPRKFVDSTLVEKAREMRAAGLTYDQIAEAVGRGRSTVALWLRNLRDGETPLERVRFPLSDEEKRVADEMKAQGKSARKIAEKLGRSRSTVAHYFERQAKREGI